MLVKDILDVDFINYKKPSMLIAFPYCSWKCEKECGKKVCQNGTLATSPNIEISPLKIVERFNNNNLTSAVVMGGLEPFDSWYDLFWLVMAFQTHSNHPDIVIYTGYYKEEIESQIEILKEAYNGKLIIKFGRYIPDQEKHFDEILGVELASDNQYAEVIKEKGRSFYENRT